MDDALLVPDGDPLDDLRTEWIRLHLWLHTALPGASSLVRPSQDLPVPDRLVTGSGGEWPDELVTWFSLHEGVQPGPWSEFLGGYRPLGSDEALAAWDGYLDAASLWDDDERVAAEGCAGEDTMVFDARLVPIALDGGGGALVVDLRPGPARGSVVGFDPEAGTDYHAVSDASIAALLRRTLQTLQGAPGQPFVDGDALPLVVAMATLGPAEDADADWVDVGSPPARASREPSWSWARIGDAVNDTSWGEDAQAMAVIGPAFDYLLTLDDEELVSATAEEPVEIPHVGLLAMLAACVDHALVARGLEPPGWTGGRLRTLSGRWPVVDVPSAELRRLRSTPAAFRAHGIELTWTRT